MLLLSYGVAYQVVVLVDGVLTEGSLPVIFGRGLSYREGYPSRHGSLLRGDATGSEGMVTGYQGIQITQSQQWSDWVG